MKILFCAAEVSPLAKVGGLADVVGSLPGALAKLGHDVRIAMPHYTIVDKVARSRAPAGRPFTASGLREPEPVVVESTTLNGDLPVYLVGNDRYFARQAVYGEGDDLERFLFFSRAVLGLPEALQWRPDVVHCHDWHAATVPMWAHKLAISPAAVFTVHNLAYQGAFDHNFMAASGLREEFVRAGEKGMQLPTNMMALGIYNADLVSTVSETYAQEILTPEYGNGLDPLLNYRKDRLRGIVNGIDYTEFDPATDPLIASNYSLEELWRKGVNKTALQKRAGFPENDKVPLIGMVTRLDEQKGFDILEKAIGAILQETSAQLVVLGKGREVYHELMQRLSHEFPDRIAVVIAFDNPLAHLIYAGSDLFLMPSRFEPCGLGQMIAMRYGAVPIVRKTGGLAETVPDLSPDLRRGRGFVFERYESQALAEAVKRAAAGFVQKDAWKQLVERDMQTDFSWEASARKYVAVYEEAVRFHRGDRAKGKTGD
ncbi:MAG: glycogen synthase [Chloroflexi bacterium]|nr:glycogen synthase [Chloroflexota bacterium]